MGRGRAGMLVVVAAIAAACGDSELEPLGGGGAGGAGAAGGQGGAAGSEEGGGGATDEGGGGSASVEPPVFEAPRAISDGLGNAFVPDIATLGEGAMIVWHEFPPESTARVVMARVEDGVPGAPTPLEDELGSARQPSIAALPDGYVVAYTANDGTKDVVRAVRLSAEGDVTDGPTTISGDAPTAAMARVAALGDEEVFTWTDGSAHWFVRRGVDENIAATEVGTTLQNGGILNFPRPALLEGGEIVVVYRDGADSADLEVFAVTRAAGGGFGDPVNVSSSPGYLSDDIDLVLEESGELGIAWVDQDEENVNAFEVEYATRSPGGDLSEPARYGDQGLWTWKPSVVQGLAAVWYTGSIEGPMFFGAPGLAPVPILPDEIVGHVALGRGTDGRYHLAFVRQIDGVRVIRYSTGFAAAP